MNVETVGRPGIYQHMGPGSTNKKHPKLQDYLRLEDERFRYFWEAIQKLAQIEEEQRQNEQQKSIM